MISNKRYEYILKKLKNEGSVNVSDLIKELNVSFETVRRDLLFLENNGKLQRFHGGAIAHPETNTFPLFSNRLNLNKEYKDELSKKAINFITEHDIIAIDSGSTSISFAYALTKHFKNLTVITHSKEVLDILGNYEGFNLFSSGGKYLFSEKAFYGNIAQTNISTLHFNKAFITPSAISLEYGLQDFCYELIDMQKQLIQSANSVYILADHTKLEKTASITISKSLSQYILISDNQVSESIKKIYIENNIQLI